MDFDLIPHTLAGEECPKNRNYRVLKVYSLKSSYSVQTCICDDHCSWDMCNLAHPPKGCLESIPSNWHWDDRKNTWVAQVELGNTFSLLK
jgi:hypothetical protein